MNIGPLPRTVNRGNHHGLTLQAPIPRGKTPTTPGHSSWSTTSYYLIPFNHSLKSCCARVPTPARHSFARTSLVAALRPLLHRQTGYHSAPIHQGRSALRIRYALDNGSPRQRGSMWLRGARCSGGISPL